MPDLLDKLIRYEQGELDDDETIELFQHLVDTGMAWQLQGSYGRMAMSLIEQELVTFNFTTTNLEGGGEDETSDPFE